MHILLSNYKMREELLILFLQLSLEKHTLNLMEEKYLFILINQIKILLQEVAVQEKKFYNQKLKKEKFTKINSFYEISLL